MVPPKRGVRYLDRFSVYGPLVLRKEDMHTCVYA